MKSLLYFVICLGLLACTSSANTETAAADGADQQADAALLAQGQRLFNIHCMACHSVDADGRTESGPHLEGIFGRQIATDDSWNFPDHITEFDFVWTEQRMIDWLDDPQSMVSNMCLPFRGLRRDSDIEALMTYLRHAT